MTLTHVFLVDFQINDYFEEHGGTIVISDTGNFHFLTCSCFIALLHSFPPGVILFQSSSSVFSFDLILCATLPVRHFPLRLSGPPLLRIFLPSDSLITAYIRCSLFG